MQTLIWIVALAPAFAQIPTPDTAELKALVERMRSGALDYSTRLQDFMCVRLMTRSADDSGRGTRWKRLETQEGELTYVSHKENYTPVKVDGEVTKLDKRVKRGYFQPGGEFGESLRKIFDPQANGEFIWDHGEVSGGSPVCIFRYSVPVAASTWVMQVNLQHVKLGHHGEVQADCETGAVTRFHMESDVPTIHENGHDIKIGATLDVRYGVVTIGSKEFLVPQQAEEVARFHTRLTKAEIQYQQYRKYDSSSTVTFEPQK
jgi:hypothetical protein